MSDKKTEFVVLEKKPEHKCDNCRHSIPATVYPKVWCFFAEKYEDKTGHCARWQTQG